LEEIGSRTETYIKERDPKEALLVKREIRMKRQKTNEKKREGRKGEYLKVIEYRRRGE